MVNFGYPYNDLVICKDSTDYLGGGAKILQKIMAPPLSVIKMVIVL